MNAERLHAVVRVLRDEITKLNIFGQFQNLVNYLQAVVQQSNSSTQQNLANGIQAFNSAVTDSAVDKFSPGWKEMLSQIGGSRFFGQALKTKVDATLAANQLTPTVAYNELNNLLSEMQKFQQALEGAGGALSSFKIGFEDLAPGQAEIGMLIPRDAVHNQLGELTSELEDLAFILNTFSEVATGKPDDLIISTVSTSEFLVYLQAHPAFAACVAVGIERVLEMYKKLLEIRKLRLDIQKLGVPDEKAAGIDEYSEGVMKDGVDRISVEIVDEYYTQGDGERKNELKVQMRRALSMTANRIDRGFNFEVRVEPSTKPAADAKPDEKTKAAEQLISEVGPKLRFTRPKGDQLLSLSEGEDDDKKPKKKPTPTKK